MTADTEPGRAETKARALSTGGWGEVASDQMARYATPITLGPHGKGRRRCHCGCGGWSTHTGRANGLALIGGCELFVRRWVRDPAAAIRSAGLA